MHIYIYTYIHIYIYTYTHIFIYSYIHIYIHTYIHTYIYTYVHIYRYIDIYFHRYTCVCVCIYIYMYVLYHILGLFIYTCCEPNPWCKVPSCLTPSVCRATGEPRWVYSACSCHFWLKMVSCDSGFTAALQSKVVAQLSSSRPCDKGWQKVISAPVRWDWRDPKHPFWFAVSIYIYVYIIWKYCVSYCHILYHTSHRTLQLIHILNCLWYKSVSYIYIILCCTYHVYIVCVCIYTPYHVYTYITIRYWASFS